MKIGVSIVNQNKMTNSVDPDETARYEPSHLDLYCLHRYLFWSARLKGLKGINTLSREETLPKLIWLQGEHIPFL